MNPLEKLKRIENVTKQATDEIVSSTLDSCDSQKTMEHKLTGLVKEAGVYERLYTSIYNIVMEVIDINDYDVHDDIHYKLAIVKEFLQEFLSCGIGYDLGIIKLIVDTTKYQFRVKANSYPESLILKRYESWLEYKESKHIS